MIIAVDFDGTLHTGEWPAIGEPAPHAIEVMRKLKEDGHCLIIWSCRQGDEFSDMVGWLLEKEIPFERINNSHPDNSKEFGYESRKVYADVYIDDKNIGGIPSWNEIYDIVSGRVKPYFIYKFFKTNHYDNSKKLCPVLFPVW
jgi:hypothetical protein